MGELDIATAIAQPPWGLTHTSIARRYNDTTQCMWLHHLRHLTLTNLQRQQRRTIGTTCDLGLVQVHLGSVGQSGRTPDSQWDAMMDKGQVALTMHHIGLGQSNVGVKRRPSAGARRSPGRNPGPGGRVSSTSTSTAMATSTSMAKS